MRIVMTNFQKHRQNSFDFPTRGLVQLQGANGRGKSTILQAIYFALYGTIKKPYSFCATTCSVVLDIRDTHGLEITRSCRPNRVIVTLADGTTLEDDAAQALIDQKVLNETGFLASSYVRQGNQRSILSMTPTEQLEFIKGIAFDSDSNDRFKVAIREMIKNAHTDGVRDTTLYETALASLEEKEDASYVAQFDIVEPPVKDINNFHLNYDKLRSIILKLQKAVKESNEKVKKLSEIQKNDKAKELHNELASLKREKDRIKPKHTDEELENLETKLANLSELREDALLYDHLLELDQELLDMKNERKASQSLCPETYDSLLLRVERMHRLCESLTKLIDLVPTKASNTLKAYVSKCKEAVHSDVIECPSCQASLVFSIDGTLQIAPDENENTKNPELTSPLAIRKFSELLATVESIAETEHLEDTTLDKIYEECENVKILKNDQHRTDGEIRDLSRSIDDLTKKSSLLEDFEDRYSDYLDEIDIDTLEEEIKTLEIEVEEEWQKRSRSSALDLEISKIEGRLKSIDPNDNSNVEEELEESRKKLSDMTDRLNSLLTKLQKYEEMKEKINRYELYEKYSEEITEIKERLGNAKSVMEKSASRHCARVRIRERMIHAEVMALDETIENINEHAKRYLDLMFLDNPISVRIEQFKQTKTTKEIRCKLNVKIDYQGYEYESIDQLSGGERQKCELAFILAVNEALNSRFLLLDECLHFMDQVVNAETIAFLKKFAHEMDKLVIVISHECVSGLFDSVINV